MNSEEYEKLRNLLLENADCRDKPEDITDKDYARMMMLEAFWKLPLKKRKSVLDAIMWRMIDIENEMHWDEIISLFSGGHSKYQPVHVRAQDALTKDPDETAHSIAKYIHGLVKKDPADFGLAANDIPEFQTIYKGLLKWQRENNEK